MFLLANYFLDGDSAVQDAVHLQAARYALAAMRLQPPVAATIGGRDIPPTDPDWLPGYRLERRRAQRLLVQADTFFAR